MYTTLGQGQKKTLTFNTPIFFSIFQKSTLYVTQATNHITVSDFDISHMKSAVHVLSKKHICEKKSNISNEIAETVNFQLSH